MIYVADNFALLTKVQSHVVFFLQLHSFLEFHLLRKPLHFFKHVIAYFTSIASKNFSHFLHVFHVLFVRLQSNTRSLAIFYMVFQTSLKFSRCNHFGRHRKTTPSQRIKFVYQLQHIVERTDMAERTVVCRTVVQNFSCLEHPRKIFVGYAH